MKFSGVFEKTAVVEPMVVKGNEVPFSNKSEPSEASDNFYKNKAIQEQQAKANAKAGYDPTGKRTMWGYITGASQYQPGSAAETEANRRQEADNFALQHGLDRTGNDVNNQILKGILNGEDDINNYAALKESDPKSYYYLQNKYNSQIAPALGRQQAQNEYNALYKDDKSNGPEWARAVYKAQEAGANATEKQQNLLASLKEQGYSPEQIDTIRRAGYADNQKLLRDETNIQRVFDDEEKERGGLFKPSYGHVSGNRYRELGNRINPEAGANLGAEHRRINLEERDAANQQSAIAPLLNTPVLGDALEYAQYYMNNPDETYMQGVGNTAMAAAMLSPGGIAARGLQLGSKLAPGAGLLPALQRAAVFGSTAGLGSSGVSNAVNAVAGSDNFVRDKILEEGNASDLHTKSGLTDGSTALETGIDTAANFVMPGVAAAITRPISRGVGQPLWNATAGRLGFQKGTAPIWEPSTVYQSTPLASSAGNPSLTEVGKGLASGANAAGKATMTGIEKTLDGMHAVQQAVPRIVNNTGEAIDKGVPRLFNNTMNGISDAFYNPSTFGKNVAAGTQGLLHQGGELLQNGAERAATGTFNGLDSLLGGPAGQATYNAAKQGIRGTGTLLNDIPNSIPAAQGVGSLSTLGAETVTHGYVPEWKQQLAYVQPDFHLDQENILARYGQPQENQGEQIAAPEEQANPAAQVAPAVPAPAAPSVSNPAVSGSPRTSPAAAGGMTSPAAASNTNSAAAGFDWQKWLPWIIGGGGMSMMLLPLLMQYFRPQPKSFLQQLLGR